MIVVTLTWPEICVAAQVATMRRVQNMKLGSARRYGDDDFDGVWQTDAISCLAEMAVAKHFDHFWCGAIGDYSAADAGPVFQVRSTEWASGRLILHPEDHDDAPYVLARVRQNKVTLVGWVYGYEGKQQEYWSAPQAHPNRLAFFVPNDVLHDMVEIPRRQRTDEAAQ
jgi:hypothetical protein